MSDVTVTLDEYSDSEFQEEMLARLDYPSVFISGINTVEELDFFNKRTFDGDRALPLYAMLEGQAHKLGMLDLTLDSLLSLKSIFNYELELHSSRDEFVSLDLCNPNTLIKFISVGGELNDFSSNGDGD